VLGEFSPNAQPPQNHFDPTIDLIPFRGDLAPTEVTGTLSFADLNEFFGVSPPEAGLGCPVR
jgi:hypothetical protein